VTAVLLEDPTRGRRSLGARRGLPGGVRRLSGPVVMLAVWQVVTALHLVDDRYLASPWSVVQAGGSLLADGTLQADLAASLSRVVWGLAFGVTAGVALALVAGLFRLGEDLVDSTMNLLRAVPVIALLPLIIVWVGIGEEAKVLLIAIGAAFPVYLNTFASIRNVDEKLVETARAFGLGRLGIVRRVVLPGSLAGFFVGFRWAMGAAWVLLVFAEQVNANRGIGYLITQAQAWNRTDIIILGLVVYGLLGLASDGVVRLLERRLLSWRRGLIAR
jgi:sulfonate transport system permease protein